MPPDADAFGCPYTVIHDDDPTARRARWWGRLDT
jgi:hypothetical protein